MFIYSSKSSGNICHKKIDCNFIGTMGKSTFFREYFPASTLVNIISPTPENSKV